MDNKRPSIFKSLPKAVFLSLIIGLFVLLLQAIFGSPKIAMETDTSRVIFLILFGAFLVVSIISIIWRPTKFGQGEFAVNGPYRFVRYPFYGAIIFLLNPGLAILLRSWFLVIVCVPVYFIWRSAVQSEEKELAGIFGKDELISGEIYLKYQKNTPRLFPNLFKINKGLFFGFWTLLIFIFIFVGLNFSAFYLRAIDWPQEKQIGEIGEIGGIGGGPKRGNQGYQGISDTVFLPIARPKYNKPNSIVINKIGIEAPLVFASGISQKELNAALDQGVVIYPGSKLPGQTGEVFLTGHSSTYIWNKTPFGQVFTMLDKLEAGDIVTIYYDQYKYDYKITKKSVVKPSEASLSSQSTQNTLTLMTCWPIGTTLKRLLVEGERVE